MSQFNIFSNIINNMKKIKVMVIGDIMLDRFVYGDVSRISPESPVAVLLINRENKMLGGAGNVLSNLAGLKSKSCIISVIGDDNEGKEISEMVSNICGDSDGLIIDKSRPSCIKTRFLANGQQLLRTDSEKSDFICDEIADKLKKQIDKNISEVQAIILSDYGKGILRDDIISYVIEKASKKNISVLIDPKGNDYSKYKGADIVTPNKKELSEAAHNMPTDKDDDVVKAAHKMLNESGIKSAVVTRSKDGMTIISKNNDGYDNPVHMRTQALEVFDVSGAGDTVITTLAAAIATGASLTDSAFLANLAGGVVVAKVGTASIYDTDLINIISDNPEIMNGLYLSDDMMINRRKHSVICTKSEAVEQVERWKSRGLKVGFTNGCFDILHAGHVAYLNDAKSKCDRLVLGLNCDESVKRLKGDERPINNENDRAEVVAALESVDMVVIFGQDVCENDTPLKLIQEINPDVLIKGADYSIEQVVGAEHVISKGGEVYLSPVIDGVSTSLAIEKIKKQA